MTDTFDWAGLAGSVVLANAGQGPDAAIAILQREIEAAITAHTKALTEAAATIATLRAEVERLTEREAQAKLDGVRAGIEASAVQCEWPQEAPVKLEYQRGLMTGCVLCERAIRALDAEAIAKGEG